MQAQKATQGSKAASDELRRRLTWLMVGRLVVATLLLGGTLALAANQEQGADGYTARFLLSMIIATYAVTLVFALWLPRARRLARFGSLQLGWDVGLITALVYASGGASSGFTFLYGTSVMMAALVVGPRAAQLTTAVSLLAYSSLSLALVGGLLQPPPDQPMERYLLQGPHATFTILVNILGLLLVAVLATNLAQRLRRAGGQLREAAAHAADLTKLNESIIRSLSSGLVTTDTQQHIRTINPAGLNILATGEEPAYGEPISHFISHPYLEKPGTQRAETTAQRGDGSTCPVGFTKSDLLDGNGRRVGDLLVFQDLTELTQLREAAERAERLAALGRVAAALAHEIRNPLGAISGSVELVADAPALDPEDRRLLAIVLREVERLNGLVNTMLDVSRPSKPLRAAHDLGALAHEVVQMAQRDSSLPKGVGIVLEAPTEPTMVVIDGAQVRQLLWNLLKNAMQHSPTPGEVQVRVAVEGLVCRVEVADEGPGVPPSMRDHLFDMFYSKRQHGVGLGLALCRQIVEAHGGAIEVLPNAPRGSRFIATFPANARPSRLTLEQDVKGQP